jgi:hypothetical protein
MRTAGGKLALFLVSAILAKQKTVIVVVLYTALVDDLCSSAIAAEVDYKHWNRDYTNGELYALVVVSANIAINNNFLYYARRLKLAGQLKAIFFDEGYIAFINTSYQKKL